MALLYWQNTFSNHLKYAATVPAGGNWILVPKFLPVAVAIAPVLGSTTAGDFITILGSGFDDGVAVTMGGVAVTNLVVVDSTVLTMTAPAHAGGAVNVVVTNSDTNVSTLVNGFTYAAPQWWQYNPAAGFGIPSGKTSWYAFGGPPVPFRFIKTESPLQTAIVAPPLAPTAPILKKALTLAPTVDPISWVANGSTPPVDTRGWYFSSNGFTAESMIAAHGAGVLPNGPQHPRAWDKVSSFATGNAGAEGGLPSVNYRNGIVYAGDDYAVGTTGPTVREFNAGADRLILVIPATTAGAIPTAIMSMLAVGDTLYISTLDSGTVPATYTGRVFSYDLVLQILTPLGLPFTGVPYAMAWHMGRLWVGTNFGNGTGGSVYFFRPGIDTVFTQDTKTLGTPGPPILDGYVGGSGPGSTDYKYGVAALNFIGHSIGSAILNVTTGPATLSSASYINLSWAAVTGATSYNVYRTSSSGTPSTTGVIGNTTALSFNDTGLTGDGSTIPASDTTALANVSTIFEFSSVGSDGSTDYQYTVIARDATGHTAAVTTYDRTLGNAVLSTTNANDIGWISVAGAPFYDVYRTSSSGTPSSTGLIGTLAVVGTWAGQPFHFIDSGLAGDASTAPVSNTSALGTANTPSALFVSVAGFGSTDYKYAIVAVSALGHSIGSTILDVPAGAATLNSSNYPVLNMPVIVPVGTASFDVYRTSSSGTPSSTGKIGNVLVSVGVFSDPGLAGDSSSLPNTNTTSVEGVCSMLSFGGKLYVGSDNVAGTFALVRSRDTTGAYSIVATGTGGTARVNNGWISMKVFQGLLYVAYWNPDTSAISKIYSITTAGVVTLVYTGASGTLRPFIVIAVNNGTQQMYALGGGAGLQAALIVTTTGSSWSDLSANLNTIATETLTPVFGFIGV